MTKAERMVVQKLETRVKKLDKIIQWLLGENGQFPEQPPPLNGEYHYRFWWRTELRKRWAESYLSNARDL